MMNEKKKQKRCAWSGLSSLIKSETSDPTGFFCDHCQRSFSKRSALTNHMKIHVSYKCKYCDAIFYSQHHMDQHVSDKHVAKHIPPINSNSSLSDLLLEDNEKSSKSTSKVPVSPRSFGVIVVKLFFRIRRLFLMLSRKSLELNPNSKSEDRKASVEIQESLFVKCVYVRLVLQQRLQHTWRHMVVRKLSNVDFVKSHIYLQLIQKLIRIVVLILPFIE